MHVEAQAAVSCAKPAAWSALAQLGRLHEWAPDVVASPSDPLAVGAVRRARLRAPAQGKDILVERVVAVTPGQSLTYEIEGGIGPLRAIVTTWSIEDAPAAGACVVRLASDITLSPIAKPLAPLVRRQWRKTLQELADGFAAWAPGA